MSWDHFINTVTYSVSKGVSKDQLSPKQFDELIFSWFY